MRMNYNVLITVFPCEAPLLASSSPVVPFPLQHFFCFLVFARRCFFFLFFSSLSPLSWFIPLFLETPRPSLSFRIIPRELREDGIASPIQRHLGARDPPKMPPISVSQSRRTPSREIKMLRIKTRGQMPSLLRLRFMTLFTTYRISTWCGILTKYGS